MEYIIKVPQTFEKDNLYLILLQNVHYISKPNYNKNNLLGCESLFKKNSWVGSSDLLDIFNIFLSYFGLF